MTPPAIVRLTPSDHADALDFLDFVFGEARPVNFARNLPGCYRPEDMPRNLAIREEGAIRAIVGVFSRDLQWGAHRLTVGGIGGVSTHRRSRGQGYMRALMEHAIAEMQANGTHLSWLQGQRQRYQRYGYEWVGQALEVELTPKNVVGLPVHELSFGPVGDDLDTLVALHAARPARHLRPPADFAHYLGAWFGSPHVARDPSGRVVGYLRAQDADRDTVSELVTAPGRALDVAAAWVRSRGRGASFALNPTMVDDVRTLLPHARTVEVLPSGMWRVFRWVDVLRATTALRAALGPVLPGRVSLVVEGEAEVVIRSDGQTFAVEEGAGSDPWVLPPRMAMRALFGPDRLEWVAEVPASSAVLAQWAPFPLPFDPADSV